MNPITSIAPITDGEAAQLVRADSLAELAAEITAISIDEASPCDTLTRPQLRTRRPRSAALRWLIGVPLAAGLAAGVLIVTSLGRPGQHLGPVNVGPPQAHAQVLSFTRHGGYITVIVRDPLADPARFRAEFAAHHLNISLILEPASPSVVGYATEYTVSAHDADKIKLITVDRSKCYTSDTGAVCPVGVRVSVNFHGRAVLEFGRAARPGEKYVATTSAFAPGEAMHGMHVKGKTIAHVERELRGRHVSVARFYIETEAGETVARSAPGGYFVYDADPWAPGQVMMYVGPSKKEHESPPDFVLNGVPAQASGHS